MSTGDMGSKVEIWELPYRVQSTQQVVVIHGNCLPGFDVFVNCFIEKTMLFFDLSKYFVILDS